ncbi:MAG TPA: DNA internalization-related competence protein ComEC/Rec2 [Deltaproteobacteria bacterium]|nr:DNA internalization-related competence protein ComEC/Rec2 [Deltaproteobacteria bacterium]
MNGYSLREFFSRPLIWPLLVLILSVLIHDSFFRAHDIHLPKGKFSLEAKLLLKDPSKNKLIVEPLKGNALLTDFSGKIQITTAEPIPASWNAGDEFHFDSIKLSKPAHYQNPGGFDYRQYLYRHNIEATAFVSNLSTLHKVKDHTHFFVEAKNRFQKRMTRWIHRDPNKEAGAVLIAMVWGDESHLSEETNELFRKMGLSHLLVLSGLQFVVVAALFFKGLLFLGRIYPKVYLYGWRQVAAVGTLALVNIYLFICVSSPSVMRAYIGISCYLIALVFKKDRDPLNILFLAALLILILNPYDLFEVSFQFSFVSVLSLILFQPTFKNKMAIFFTKFGRFGNFAGNLVSSSLAVFIGLGPLLLFYFHTLQPHGLWMNLWAIPYVEMLVVPLGLAGLVLAPLVPGLAKVFLWMGLKLTAFFLTVLHGLDSFLDPPPLFYPPYKGELVLYYLILMFLFFRFSSKVKWSGVAILVLILVSEVGWSFGFFKPGNQFSITQIDVGQGDSLLLELPGHKNILVDGGGSAYFDMGENVLIPNLLYRRIPALDVVCVTHADTDHYLGLQTLLEKYPVRELWWNGFVSEDERYNQLIKSARQRGIVVREMTKGMKTKMDQAEVSVLWPPAGMQQKKDNNESIVLQIKVKEHTALLTGDAEFPSEASLVEEGLLQSADYLKLGHHGSRTSSSEMFLQAVHPQLATAGLKEGNRFHHPHPEVVERLGQWGIPFFRTDRDGAITIHFKEGGFLVDRFVGEKVFILRY